MSRVKFLAVIFFFILLLASDGHFMPFKNFSALLVGVFVLLALSVMALWPDDVDAEHPGRRRGTWADRIDFDQPPQ